MPIEATTSSSERPMSASTRPLRALPQVPGAVLRPRTALLTAMISRPVTTVTASAWMSAGTSSDEASPPRLTAISCGVRSAAASGSSRSLAPKLTRAAACGTVVIRAVMAMTTAEKPIIVLGFVRMAWNAPS